MPAHDDVSSVASREAAWRWKAFLFPLNAEIEDIRGGLLSRKSPSAQRSRGLQTKEKRNAREELPEFR